MSFVDELGIRSHGYTVNKFLATRVWKTQAAANLAAGGSPAILWAIMDLRMLRLAITYY